MSLHFAVQLVHGHLDTDETEGFDSGGGYFGALGDKFFLLRGELAEDVIHLLTGKEVAAYAETEAGILLCAEYLGYVLQAVVTGIAATGFHSHLAEGQGDVIHTDEKVGEFDLLLLHPVANGITAQVHECAGF